MTHLGSVVSALADGQLGPEATDRALVHVAGCAECADELAAARAARRALAGALDIPVDPDLTRRLIALGAARPEDCATSRSAGGAAPRFADDSVPLPGSADGYRLPAGCLDGDLTRPRRIPGRWLVAATTGVGVLTATLFVLGDQPDVVPPAHPAHALTVLSRAATASGWTGASAVAASTAVGPARTGQATMAADAPTDAAGEPVPEEVAAELRDLGWQAPPSLPAGYQVTAVRADPEGPNSLEVDLTGTHGTIVVTLHQGRLDPTSVRSAEPVELDGGTLHVLSTAPWHGVWQCGGMVVSVVAPLPSEALEQVITAYPAQEYDAGVPARIVRGWTSLAGAWTP